MKLGICSNWGEDLEAFRGELRTAKQCGYDLVGIGDTPAGWHELLVSMTIVAYEAPGLLVTPMVTAPFMRHPLTSASAMSSLWDLTGGRVAYGLATGGSNVVAIGRGRATQKEVRAEFDALRGLFSGQSIEWEGRTVSGLRFARPVPIYYSAFGPKAFALAGEKADGVILFAGDEKLPELKGRIAAVHEGARAAGRDPASVDIWVISFCSVRPDREQAIEDLAAFISVNALTIALSPELLEQTPEHLREPIREYKRRYDVTEHVVPHGRNVSLMDELGLRDYLSQFDTTKLDEAGTTKFLRELESMGVSTFIASMPGHADPLPTIRGLAAARDAM
jgi:alkanesulfonate monooxygenase SsuD/methylene tetrahydromethanopterin reductase-like flavin-dependent oxidoreductase (luciferase family)